jgi:hypothetical protein
LLSCLTATNIHASAAMGGLGHFTHRLAYPTTTVILKPTVVAWSASLIEWWMTVYPELGAGRRSVWLSEMGNAIRVTC